MEEEEGREEEGCGGLIRSKFILSIPTGDLNITTAVTMKTHLTSFISIQVGLKVTDVIFHFSRLI